MLPDVEFKVNRPAIFEVVEAAKAFMVMSPLTLVVKFPAVNLATAVSLVLSDPAVKLFVTAPAPALMVLPLSSEIV